VQKKLQAHPTVQAVDPPSSLQAAQAQSAALRNWLDTRTDRRIELSKITQPTLIVNGNRDIMLPTINSHVLAEHIPNAQLVVYPDSGHGAHFQYPQSFLS
jgi:pimeloyl-ACP methyl ester carboxylesterase